MKKIKTILLIMTTISCLIIMGLNMVIAQTASEEEIYFSSSEEMAVNYGAQNDYGKNGVKITLNNVKGKDRVDFQYNNYLTESEIRKGFLSFSIIPSEIGKNDFDFILVTLTDGLDESRKLVYAASPHPDTAGWWNTFAANWVTLTDDLEPSISIQYNNTNVLNIKGTNQRVVSKNTFISPLHSFYKGNYMDCGNLLGDKFRFFVRKSASDKIDELSFSFDGKIAYMNGGTVANITDREYIDAATSNGDEKIKALFDPERVSNLFTSGYAKMTVSFLGVNSSSISVHISKLGEQDLSVKQGEVSDTSPLIVADIKTNGIVGKPYVIPSVTAKDLKDGDLASSVSCKVLKGTQNVYEGMESFTFSDAGEYKLKYSVTNGRGISYDKEYKLTVFAERPVTEYEAEMSYKDNYFIGDEIILPSSKAYSELSIRADRSVEAELLVQKDGRVIENFGYSAAPRVYTIKEAGSYLVIVRYTDQFGVSDSVSAGFTAVRSIIFNTNLSVSLTYGTDNAIEDFTFINNVNEAYENSLTRAIFVNDNKIFEARGSQVLYGSLKVPASSITGDSVFIKYAVSLDGNQYSYFKIAEVPVIRPTYMADYMVIYDSNGFGASAEKYNLAEETVYSVSKDTGFMLPQALYTGDLYFSFDIKNTGAEFGGVRVILQSAKNRDKQLIFVLRPLNNSLSKLSFNGSQPVNVSGSFSNDNSWFNWKWDNIKFNLCDNDGNVLANVDRWSDGTAFYGFENDLAILKFEIFDVTAGNPSLSVKRVVNQSFSSSVTQSKVDPFVDLFPPIIAIKGDMASQKVIYAGILKVYSAKAYDVVDFYAVVTVSVMNPEGRWLYRDAPIDKDISIILDQYGKYSVIYKATDSTGIFTSEKRFNYTVNDEISPSLYVNGTIDSSFKVGDTVTLPQATAIDNYDLSVKLYIFVVKPNGKREVYNNNYTFTETGEYRIIYYAYDKNYNFNQKEFIVNVSEGGTK